jgi:5'-methylthioadenosine phosphorylase
VGITAIIAGSGFEQAEPFRNWEPSAEKTPFGTVELLRGQIGSRSVVFAARHGRQHSVPPHLINYKAIVTALSQLGVTRIIGTAAVGSLSTDLGPGTAAVLTDFIDFSRRGPITLYDSPGSTVVHTDFSEPYCSEVSEALLTAAGESGLEVTTPCTYLSTDGPRYETPAEISMFRSWGADVVGMTNAPEAVICREARICYGAIVVITNLACGISSTRLSHTEVLKMMKSVELRLAQAVTKAVQIIPDNAECKCGVGGHV